MSANDAWAHTPRQYRPHAYVPTMPQSTSLSNLDYEPYFNPSRSIPTYNRRRTDTNLPVITPMRATATVAKSRLTASVSNNDISHPTLPQRHRLAEIHKVTPSRIPTPVSKSPAPHLRYVSTPVLPSQRRQKENMQQVPKQLRLLGPISPTRTAHPQMSRSRTMDMLSSLTSSFSRSSLNLSASSRQTSASSARSTVSVSSISSPIPLATTFDICQIHTAQPNTYWSGRFQGLNDRFHNEVLQNSLHDSKIMRQYTNRPPTPPPILLLPSLGRKSKPTRQECATADREIEPSNGFLQEEREMRMKRVLRDLETFCVTQEAKRSLWEWQLIFARQEQDEALLPAGGKMTDDKGGWVSRMGRAIIGSGNSNTQSIGRRTGLALGRRRNA